MKKVLWAVIFALGVALPVSALGQAPKPTKVRVGHFPNITHAQALYLHATGDLEKAYGPNTKVEWKIFNAGPSAIEAIFSGDLDIAVVGPSPAINGYVKSNGEALAVVAGSASGGAALVRQAEVSITKPEDFKGKKIASPQLGNTQDVALRSWLKASGLKLKDLGGDVQVVPLSNGDIMTLFLKKEIAAAWTVEPWVSSLELNAGAKVYLDEGELWAGGRYSTALVLVRKKFLKENPQLVKIFLKQHVEVTDKVAKGSEDVKEVIRLEISKETGKEFPKALFDKAFARIEATYDPLVSTVIEQALNAHRAGFLKKKPDLTSLFDLAILEEILKERGIEPEWNIEVPKAALSAALDGEGQK